MPHVTFLPNSRFAKYRLVFLLVCLVGLIGYRYAYPFYRYTQYQPQIGDLIFQSLPHMDLVNAIEGITASPYSHVGIVLKKGDEWFVRESIMNVHDTPLYTWILRGRNAGAFDVFRLNAQQQIHIPQFIAETEKYLGRLYDVKYAMDDKKIYCSELVYKAWFDATQTELGLPVALGDMDWLPYRDTIVKYEEGEPPLTRRIVSPQSVADSAYVSRVY